VKGIISQVWQNRALYQGLKRMVYGYKSLEYFKCKIHQHCGLLNPGLNTLKTT